MHTPTTTNITIRRSSALKALQMIQRLELSTALEEQIALDGPGQPGTAVVGSVAVGGHAEDIVEFFEGALSFVCC